MMNVVERNFFRLLRSGTFNNEERIEPMSAYKWGLVFQMAMMHNVGTNVYEGLLHCSNQFFLRLTDEQWERWDKTTAELRKKANTNDADDEDEFLRADQLTNPLLNYKLQAILDDEQSDTSTRKLLLLIIRTLRHILNKGLPIRQLTDLGVFLKTESHRVDFIQIEQWIRSLRLQQIAQLEGLLLQELLGLEPGDIPFIQEQADKNIENVTQELINSSSNRFQDFYFSQDGGDIFVHTSNGLAMLGHVRRSARYFRYYPSETLTNFFASFIHSLSHIEE